jgi:hypothetical protein
VYAIAASVGAEDGLIEYVARWAALGRNSRTSMPAPLGGWRRHRQTCEGRIRELPGPEFDSGRAEGRGLTLDDAVSIALE